MAKEFNAEWAIVARESRGLTQVELSERMRIPQARLSRFENERAIPNDEEIQALAKATGYDPDLFFRSDRVRGPGMAAFLHRKLARVKVGDTKRIHGTCAVVEAQVDRLLASVPADAEYSIPRIDLEADHDGDIERAAQYLRARWDLPPGPIRNLTQVIERAGGLIIEQDFKVKDVDALHRWRHDLPPIFFVNRGRPSDRARFSLAHELGHAVLHQDLELEDGAEARAEREANAFASAFLAPADQIRPEFPALLTLRHLPALKTRWRMSMQALIVRACDIGVIDESKKKRLFMEISQRGWRRKEPIEIEPETPSRWYAMLEHHRHLDYSSEELASMMYLDTNSLEDALPPAVAGRIIPEG